MRFTPKEDIKHGQVILEAGATLSSEKHDISDELLEIYYDLGVVEIEGRDPAPEKKTTTTNIRPAKTTLAVSKTEA